MITAIILAGGYGTRLRSVVSEVPKPLASINGRPFLEYLLSYWISQGVNRFIFSVGYQAQKIIHHFGESYAGIPIDYAIESTPLGTGGGLLNSIKFTHSSGPVLVLNGDSIFTINLESLIEFSIKKQSDWTVAMKMNLENGRYGALQIDDSYKIISTQSKSDSIYINSGVYLINADLVRKMDLPSNEFFSLEGLIFGELLKKEKNFYGIPFDDYFIDIGVPEDYFLADEILSSKITLLT